MSSWVRGVFRRRVVTPLALVSAALIVLVLVLAPERARRWADTAGMRFSGGGTSIALATAGEQGMYHKFGVLLGETLRRRGPYEVAVLETAGSIEDLALLRKGEADFAFVQGGLGVPMDGIAVVAAIERQYAHVIVPADSQIRHFRDLRGKRIGVGPSGSGFESLAERVFGYYAFMDAPTLVTDHNRDLAQAFLDGEIDAVFTVYSLFAPAVETLLDTGWYRLVPIEEADALSRFLPQIDAVYLPSGLYGPDRTLPAPDAGPFATLAVDTLLVARVKASDHAVTALLEGLHDTEFLREARLAAPPDRGRVEKGLAPVHPAALRFYGRNDPVSSDLFEIASFFLAGLIGLVSLVHYLAGRVHQRGKERRRRAIRPYFEKMLDFGNGIEAAGDPSILTGLLHDMMAVQREAEHAWLKGRLDTEDMENLYAVYGIRSGNALQKIQNLLIEASVRDSKAPDPGRYPGASEERRTETLAATGAEDADSQGYRRTENADREFAAAPFFAEDRAPCAGQHVDFYVDESGVAYDEAHSAGAVAPEAEEDGPAVQEPPADTPTTRPPADEGNAPVKRRPRKANLEKTMPRNDQDEEPDADTAAQMHLF